MIRQPTNSILHNSKYYNLLSLVSLGIFCIISTFIWSGDNFLRITEGMMGEAFEAYHGALNIIRYGWQWGGLQDMATNPSSSAHSVLYIHHPNFGLYFSYLLHVLGITNIETQNLISGIFTYLGLFAGWFFCFKFTKSYAVPSVLLVFLAIDIQLAEHWAFNIHRSSGYLSIFLPLGFSFIWFKKNAKFSYHTIFILIGEVLALGQDYMVFFTLFLILCLIPICSGKTEESKKYLRYYAFIIASFTLLFILRQLQVILGAGIEIWQRDFLYQILNRLHLETLFIGDWPATTTNFYLKESVINPGFAPYTDLLTRFTSFLFNVGNLTLSNVSHFKDPNTLLINLVGTGFIAMVTLIGLCGFFNLLLPNTRRMATRITIFVSYAGIIGIAMMLAYGFYNSWINIFDKSINWALCTLMTISIPLSFYLPIERKNIILNAPTREIEFPSQTLSLFSFVLLLATVVMYFIFPTYFMLVFPTFLIAPCFISIWTISILTPVILHWGNNRFSTFAILLLIIIKLSVMLPIVLDKPAPSKHSQVLRQLKNNYVVSNFTPASIASFTHTFSGYLTEKGFENLLQNGKVTPQDYFMLFERDRLENPLYRKPSYAFFNKGFGSKEQLKLLKSYKAKIISEGSSYVLFEVPKDLNDM